MWPIEWHGMGKIRQGTQLIVSVCLYEEMLELNATKRNLTGSSSSHHLVMPPLSLSLSLKPHLNAMFLHRDVIGNGREVVGLNNSRQASFEYCHSNSSLAKSQHTPHPLFNPSIIWLTCPVSTSSEHNSATMNDKFPLIMQFLPNE